jgi:hypothetical protein
MRGPYQRPSFLSNNPRPTIVTEDIVFSDTDSDNEGLSPEELAQEADLSRQHGEAADDTSRKRLSNGEAALLDYSKAHATKKARPVRPKLQESDLTGPCGLIRLTTELPRIQYTSTTPTRAASALYMNQLLKSYASIVSDWQPQTDWRDSLHECYNTLGSKASVKQYMQEQLRDTHRQAYVEGVLGKEKANHVLQAYRAYQTNTSLGATIFNSDGTRIASNGTARGNGMNGDLQSALTAYRTRQAATQAANNAVDSDDEGEFQFGMDNNNTTGTSAAAITTANNPLLAVSQSTRSRLQPFGSDDKDDEDGVLEDEDDILLATMELQQARRRHILDDDSDDEDVPPTTKAPTKSVQPATDTSPAQNETAPADVPTEAAASQEAPSTDTMTAPTLQPSEGENMADTMSTNDPQQ